MIVNVGNVFAIGSSCSQLSLGDARQVNAASVTFGFNCLKRMSHAFLDLPLDEIAKKVKAEKKAQRSEAGGRKGPKQGQKQKDGSQQSGSRGQNGRGQGKSGRAGRGGSNKPQPYRRVRQFSTFPQLFDRSYLFSRPKPSEYAPTSVFADICSSSRRR